MSVRNTIKIIIGSAIFLLILFVIFLFIGKKQKQTGNPINSKITEISPARLPLVGLSIKDFIWRDLDRELPVLNKKLISEVDDKDGLTRKYSPDGNYWAYLRDLNLTIENQAGSHVTVDVTPKSDAVNFVWITNDLILLVEKESAFRKIDRLYSIKAESGEKNFFAGSFPIVERLKLDWEPIVFEDGRQVLFQDNGGGYWLLGLIY